MKNTTLLLVGILVIVVAIFVNSQATPSNTASAPLVDEPAIEDVPFFGGGDDDGGDFGGGGSFSPTTIIFPGHHHHHHRHPHPGPKPPPGPSCASLQCKLCVKNGTAAQAACCKAGRAPRACWIGADHPCCDAQGNVQTHLNAGKNAGNKLGGQHRRGSLHANFMPPHHPSAHFVPHAHFVPPHHANFVPHHHPSIHFAPDRTHNAFYSHH